MDSGDSSMSIGLSRKWKISQNFTCYMVIKAMFLLLVNGVP